MSTYAWSEPDATLRDMLLTEPGSRVEGETADILRILFYVVHESMTEQGMGELEADQIALRLLPRMHAALADRGYVVRDLASDG